jgi:hypothetical protein
VCISPENKGVRRRPSYLLDHQLQCPVHLYKRPVHPSKLHSTALTQCLPGQRGRRCLPISIDSFLNQRTDCTPRLHARLHNSECNDCRRGRAALLSLWSRSSHFHQISLLFRHHSASTIILLLVISIQVNRRASFQRSRMRLAKQNNCRAMIDSPAPCGRRVDPIAQTANTPSQTLRHSSHRLTSTHV